MIEILDTANRRIFIDVDAICQINEEGGSSKLWQIWLRNGDRHQVTEEHALHCVRMLGVLDSAWEPTEVEDGEETDTGE